MARNLPRILGFGARARPTRPPVAGSGRGHPCPRPLRGAFPKPCGAWARHTGTPKPLPRSLALIPTLLPRGEGLENPSPCGRGEGVRAGLRLVPGHFVRRSKATIFIILLPL